jgi:hypothetical protein
MTGRAIDSHAFSLERRQDGAVLVRVRSNNDRRLPDTVFAFRSGDPQYHYWDQQLRNREHAG